MTGLEGFGRLRDCQRSTTQSLKITILAMGLRVDPGGFTGGFRMGAPEEAAFGAVDVAGVEDLGPDGFGAAGLVGSGMSSRYS